MPVGRRCRVATRAAGTLLLLGLAAFRGPLGGECGASARYLAQVSDSTAGFAARVGVFDGATGQSLYRIPLVGFLHDRFTDFALSVGTNHELAFVDTLNQAVFLADTLGNVNVGVPGAAALDLGVFFQTCMSAGPWVCMGGDVGHVLVGSTGLVGMPFSPTSKDYAVPVDDSLARIGVDFDRYDYDYNFNDIQPTMLVYVSGGTTIRRYDLAHRAPLPIVARLDVPLRFVRSLATGEFVALGDHDLFVLDRQGHVQTRIHDATIGEPAGFRGLASDICSDSVLTVGASTRQLYVLDVAGGQLLPRGVRSLSAAGFVDCDDCAHCVGFCDRIPIFDHACGWGGTAAPGDVVTFDVSFASNGANALTVEGMPAGATMNPPLPLFGASQVTSTFSWTPTPADTGDYTITFACGGSQCASFVHVVPDVSTPVVLARFDARATDAGVEIDWEWGAGGDPGPVALERSRSLDGPWQPVAGANRTRGGLHEILDGSAGEGVSWYRLSTRTGPGGTRVLGRVSVRVPGSAVSRLETIWPNPMGDGEHVRFRASENASVTIWIGDLAGRRLATLVSGRVAPGEHEIVWDGRTPVGTARPGLYFVHFVSSAGITSRRFVITR